MQATDAVGAVPVPDEAAAAAPAAPAEAAQQEQAGQQAAAEPDPQTVEPPTEAPASGEEAPPPPPPPPPAVAEPAGEAEGVTAEEAQDEAAPVPAAEEVKEEAAEGGVKEEAAEAGEASEAPAKAEPPSDEALVARLRQLLAEVDLATTTEKQLRRKLEAEYGCDLADRKALLRAEINAYLQDEEEEGEGEAAEEEGEEEEAEATSGRKRGRGGGSGSSLGSFLSPEMQEFLGEERLPRTQVVKRLWAYIKENGLQDPKDKRVIIFDEKLQKLFPGTRSNMFKLQKLLSKHCKTSDVVGGDDDDEEEGAEEAESEGEEPAAKKRRASSSAARSSGGRRSSAAGGERKPGGFQKECQLSEEMAAWIGKPAASRPEITKFFWAYCKEQGLQDPSDKSFILADDTLKALTGEDRFKGFGFAKLIKQHLS